MDPLSIAFGLAQFVPGILKWVTGDDKSAKVAEKVVDIAKAVTGRDDGAGALAALKADPAAVLKFKEAVMVNESALEQAYLADRQSARLRDMEFLKAGTRNYRADALSALAVLAVILLTWAVWKTPELTEFHKGTITLVLGRFLGYIDQVYQFEFGSTRSNKTKDDTINFLSR